MKASAQVSATPAIRFSQNKARHLAAKVLKAWCAYYDPAKVCFGNPSKCLECARDCQGNYDPSNVVPGDGRDGSCKRAHIIVGQLPSVADAMKRYF